MTEDCSTHKYLLSLLVLDHLAQNERWNLGGMHRIVVRWAAVVEGDTLLGLEVMLTYAAIPRAAAFVSAKHAM